jgi:hypothetical protein
MKKFIFSAILFLLATTIWFSCKKETTLVPSTNTPTDFATMRANKENLKAIKVIDGVLHFSDGDQAFNEYEAILSMTSEEFATWAKLNNFNSMETLVEEAKNELDNVTTEIEQQNTLAKYANYVRLINDEVIPFINTPLYRRITNVDGKFAAGSSVFEVVNDRIVEARDGDWSKIINAQQITKSNEENNVYVSYMFGNSDGVSVSRDGNCGTYNESGCQTGDRKVKFVLQIVNGVCCCGGTRRMVTAEVWGYKRVAGIWFGYSTPLSYSYTGYEVRDLFGNIQSYDNWSFGLTGKYLYGSRWIDPQPCYSNCQFSNQFIKIKGIGDSQGVSANHWAFICCGYTTGCPPATQTCD